MFNFCKKIFNCLILFINCDNELIDTAIVATFTDNDDQLEIPYKIK